MLLIPFADKTRFFKETPEGVNHMCKVMEERVNDERIRIAVNLLKIGILSNEKIAEATDLSIEVINELEEKLKGIPA